MWKKVLILLGMVSTTFLAILFYSFSIAVSQIKSGNYSKASKTARMSLNIIEPISKITFGKSSNIELAKHFLYLVEKAPSYANSLTIAGNLNLDNNYIFDILGFKHTLEDLNSHVQVINSKIEQSKTVKKIVDKEYLLKIDQLVQHLPNFIKILNNFSTRDQKVIVVFQNSDEVRATGGFMGSYAILDVANGKIIEIITEDIYDAEGQFDGFIEAPNGVKEYLSDDKGLRLTNANWHPDFPKSASQILQFFALGNKKNAKTLVAVNPDYAKAVLSITGNIEIKDYNTIIDSNNITEVLRSRRDTFFPGSKQKKHLISQLLTQLQIKVSELDEQSKLSIIQQTLNQLWTNNIQLYSGIDEVDEIFSEYDFRQELEYKENSDYLFLVESNVGINKANKNIFREVDLEIGDRENLLTIDFKNNNLPPSVSNLTKLINDDEVSKNETNEVKHLGYVNYQRVIVALNQNLESIKYDGQIISDWNENIIENSNHEEFKEIGFIITLKEQESSSLEIKFKNAQQNNNEIYIQKQPGLPATPYIVKKDGYISQFLLEEDILVKLK